jgi:hypothetical protein
MHRKTLAVLLAVIAVLSTTAVVSANGAGGVSPGPAFYVDGEMYRTVATPNDLSGTGAPDHSYDIIYDIPGQLNVAEAAPGDRDYNGGRWMVHALAYDGSLGVLMSFEDVQAAIAAGAATDMGVVAQFTCPVIKFPKGK